MGDGSLRGEAAVRRLQKRERTKKNDPDNTTPTSTTTFSRPFNLLDSLESCEPRLTEEEEDCGQIELLRSVYIPYVCTK